MRHAFIMLFIAALSLISACGKSGLSDQIENASAELASGDVAECSKICNSILADSTQFNALSVKQLCELSQIYVSLGDDIEANDASAARCLSRARDIDADSVADYIRKSAPDIAVRLTVLDRVSTYMQIPRDSLGEIEEPLDYPITDSITE